MHGADGPGCVRWPVPLALGEALLPSECCLQESEVRFSGFQAAQNAICVCLITLWLVCSLCFCQLVFKKEKADKQEWYVKCVSFYMRKGCFPGEIYFFK